MEKRFNGSVVLAATLLILFVSTHAFAQGPKPESASSPQDQTKLRPGNDPRVIEVILKAENAHPTGQCPTSITFNGSITTNGPATVKYTFTRSDGATAPVLELRFPEAGTQSVTTSWALGDAKALPAYEGWQAIKILSPNAMESSHETGAFALTCSIAGNVSSSTLNGVPQPSIHVPPVDHFFTTDLVEIQSGRTARLELKSTDSRPVTVRLQFVDKEGKVLARRDATIKPGGTETFGYTAPMLRRPSELMSGKIRAQFATPIPQPTPRSPVTGSVTDEAQFAASTAGPVGANSISSLQPALRILEPESGKTIRLIGPEGFKAKLLSVDRQRASIEPFVSRPGNDLTPDNDLAPDPNLGRSSQSLVESLRAAGNFTKLLLVLDKAGLTDTLSNSTEGLTLFAPDDAAFALLPAVLVAKLTAARAQARAFILPYILTGKFMSKDLLAPPLSRGRLRTFAGTTLQVSAGPGGAGVVIIGDLPTGTDAVGKTGGPICRIISADHVTANGVYHVVTFTGASGGAWR